MDIKLKEKILSVERTCTCLFTCNLELKQAGLNSCSNFFVLHFGVIKLLSLSCAKFWPNAST